MSEMNCRNDERKICFGPSFVGFACCGTALGRLEGLKSSGHVSAGEPWTEFLLGGADSEDAVPRELRGLYLRRSASTKSKNLDAPTVGRCSATFAGTNF
jgi:hypothetical protein